MKNIILQLKREKGMWKEPKVMHTEIGDFRYFDDEQDKKKRHITERFKDILYPPK